MRQSSLKGQERAIVNQTNTGTVSKATLGKLLAGGGLGGRGGGEAGGAYMGFSESSKGKGLISAGSTSHEHDKDPNRPSDPAGMRV